MIKYFTFITIYIIYLFNFTYINEPIKTKEVFIDNSNVYIKRINNKLLIKQKYEKNIYGINENGNYTIYYDNGEYIGYKSSYFNKYRNNLKKILKRNLDDKLYDFSLAIFLNEKSNIDKSKKELLKNKGISHLLAISGLHFSLIYTILLKILFSLSHKLKNILCLLILTLYVLTLGFFSSVVRAYIMIFLYIISILLNEKANSKKSLIISFIITILTNPYQIINISYLMTYISTFLIIYFNDKNIIIKSILLQLGLSPLIFLQYKKVYLFSFLYNLIFIPLFEILILLIILNIIFPINDITMMYYNSFFWILNAI